ncbi:MAG TPA: RNA polymerase sigma factor [Steroidobacteraceae bacterium]
MKEKAQSGNVGLQEPLQLSTAFGQYRAALHRFFRRRLSNPAEVEDCVQEVFLRLARHENIESIDNAHAYVFQTAANILRDRGRMTLTRRTRDHEPFEDAIHGSEHISPERVIIARQSVAVLKAALLRLPERTQAVFVLHRFEGLRYGEIARRLGLSMSAVEKHMMKAMRHIGKSLEWP